MKRAEVGGDVDLGGTQAGSGWNFGHRIVGEGLRTKESLVFRLPKPQLHLEDAAPSVFSFPSLTLPTPGGNPPWLRFPGHRGTEALDPRRRRAWRVGPVSRESVRVQGAWR